MTIVPIGFFHNLVGPRVTPGLADCTPAYRLKTPTAKLALTLLSTLLLCGGLAIYSIRATLLAANSGLDNTCNWYIVRPGDNLTRIAWQYHTTIATLAHANQIPNINLIFVDQRICVPLSSQANAPAGGIHANGTIPWYNYRALSWSNRSQVRNLLYKVAAIHHLPPRLLLAIAWQESGWTQHVIAWDGGIGVMQLMPYTAMGINEGTGIQRDPYELWDNLNLGATYLSWLWQNFDGDLPRVISAYNEGGWAVRHRGIFNWSYVNNVLALMNSLD